MDFLSVLPSTSALCGVNSESVHLETCRPEGPKSGAKSLWVWPLKESGPSYEVGSKCGSVLSVLYQDSGGF